MHISVSMFLFWGSIRKPLNVLHFFVYYSQTLYAAPQFSLSHFLEPVSLRHPKYVNNTGNMHTILI